MNNHKYLLIAIATTLIAGATLLYVSLLSDNNQPESNMSVNSQKSKTWKTISSSEWGISFRVPATWQYKLWNCPNNCSPFSFPTQEDPEKPYYYYTDGLRETKNESYTTKDPELYKQPYTPNDDRLSFGVMYFQKTAKYDATRDLKVIAGEVLPLEPNIKIGNVLGWEVLADNTQDTLTSARLYSKSYIIEREKIIYRLDFVTATEEFYRQYDPTIKRILNSVQVSDI